MRGNSFINQVKFAIAPRANQTSRIKYLITRSKPLDLYSWVLNNYWTTNFRASQEGELKWNYYLTSSNDNTDAFATRFGWGARIPLLARVFPAGETAAADSARPWMEVSAPNLLLVAARPAQGGNGILLQLRETEGKEAVLKLAGLLNGNIYTAASEVNLFGEEIKEINEELKIGPLETRFVWLRE